MILPCPHAPNTKADFDRMLRRGCRDIKGAARRIGVSETEMWGLIRRGLIWSYKPGKRRLVPVTELQRYSVIQAMEAERERLEALTV